MSLGFKIYGEPKPLARPRVYRVGAKGMRAVQPRTDWFSAVQVTAMDMTTEALQYDLWDKPLDVRLDFHMKRVSGLPKSYEKPHIKKPDLDNLIKSVVDGLSGILFEDDKQIVDLHASKRYARGQEPPGCWVEIVGANAEPERG